jgi:hypothetical protein
MGKNWFKKTLVIAVIVIFLGTNIVLGFDNYNLRYIEKTNLSFIDEVDQQQTFCNGVMEIGDFYYGKFNLMLAQSFTPQKNFLTRIYLYVERYGQPNAFHLAIRKDLYSANLTTVSLSYSKIPSNNLAWVEFNFNDIPVVAGEQYYMIMSTKLKSNTVYGIGTGSNNPYPDGDFWMSMNWYEWEKGWDDDLCFKTYGTGGPPNKPSTPSGKVNGKINVDYTYTSVTTDLDGDQIYYLFDWDDGTDSGWIGPFNSGIEGSASHRWTVKGNYDVQVKAKDIYDAESPWSDPLSVTMPRDKTLASSPFLRFSNRYLLIQKVLLYLIK